MINYAALSGIALVACSMLSAVGAATVPPGSVDLTFEDRVRAQAAIERVYYEHRIGTKIEFETAVPGSVLEKKVRRFLRQSRALERQWKTTVTAEMLDRELARMVRDTHNADRLWELFAALDSDPVLIRECLARPILVDRLVRNFFAEDDLLHAEARSEAARLREKLLDGRMDPSAAHRLRTVEQISDRTFDDSFTVWRSLAPDSVGEVGDVVERDAALEIRVVLVDEPDLTRVATFRIPRLDPQRWWNGFEAGAVRTVARYDAALPERATPGDCGPGEWRPYAEAPSPRSGHVALWTGSEMIIWGPSNLRGSRYDPATDTWFAMSEWNEPDLGSGATGVWTGSEMIVYGGLMRDYPPPLVAAAHYDPVTDAWNPVTPPYDSGRRFGPSAIWTGEEMIIWGGTWEAPLSDGWRYNPDTGQWRSMATTGAPWGFLGYSMIWAGDRMIVWGGHWSTTSYNKGWAYDPDTDTWTPLSEIGAPEIRTGHSATWTGDAMIIWGGMSPDVEPGYYYDNGFRYVPDTDTWSPIVDAPGAKALHSAVWTGSRMIVWGGSDRETQVESRWLTNPTDSGYSYDPGGDEWTVLSDTNTPSPREEHTAVWTGDTMIVWGGRNRISSDYRVSMGTGGRYDSSTDSWTPTASPILWGREADSTRSRVWTGNEIIEWGGSYYSSFGTIHDLTTGALGYTSLIDAPSERNDHSAVWTGTEMIVWGGNDSSEDFRTGGRYDLAGDSWIATSTSDAPIGRNTHMAVWTGSEMIVWGGVAGSIGSGVLLDNGSRYDPERDDWTAMSKVGAPSAREGHSAAWTGNEWIIWGGELGTGGRTNDGARYEPAGDRWRSVSTLGAPTPRESATATWSGSEMIVWGGFDTAPAATGGRYDPLLNRWQPMTHFGAPDGRYLHSAIWTGAELIVWGGYDGTKPLGDGSRYSPAADQWTALPSLNAPDAGYGPMGIWTGSTMIVYGGRDGTTDDPHPGYNPTGFLDLPDVDGDGLCGPDDCDDVNPFCGTDCTDADGDALCVTSDCDDGNANCSTDCTDSDSDDFCVTHDCDERNPDTYPGATEINDGQDNQCPGDIGHGLVDEIDGTIGFYDPLDRDTISWPQQVGATVFRVARSTSPRFDAGCVVPTTLELSWTDTDPVPDKVCFHYLVSASLPNEGSWGADSGGLERTAVCP